jgi:hypothetical protein
VTQVLEWKTWSVYNKYSKASSWKGYALIDSVYNSRDELEAAVQEVYKRDANRWAQVKKKLNCTSHEVPTNIVHQLQELCTRELREVYGKNPSDGSPLYKPKRIDLIRFCEKNNITVGVGNWEQQALDLIEGGTIV